ncbi:MAG TPA: hypothetical protein VGC99_27235 [Candidatus Tectomicrobia bacterium]
MHHRHADHGFTRPGQLCISFGQAPGAGEPATGALHAPPLGQYVEALEAFEPFDDHQGDSPPGPPRPHPGDELASVGVIGPEQAEPRTPVPEDLQELLGAIAVLPTGRRDHHTQEQAERVDHNRPRTPVDLRVRVTAVDPPVSVVLTDWRSMIPALGWHGLPTAARTSPRRRSGSTCLVPSSRHWRPS